MIKCRDCVAFRTHFCPFDHTGVVLANDKPCSDFYALEDRLQMGKRVKAKAERVFIEVAKIVR